MIIFMGSYLLNLTGFFKKNNSHGKEQIFFASILNSDTFIFDITRDTAKRRDTLKNVFFFFYLFE